MRCWPNDAMGQSRRFRPIRATSAFHPIATVERTSEFGRFVPLADIGCSIRSPRRCVPTTRSEWQLNGGPPTHFYIERQTTEADPRCYPRDTRTSAVIRLLDLPGHFSENEGHVHRWMSAMSDDPNGQRQMLNGDRRPDRRGVSVADQLFSDAV